MGPQVTTHSKTLGRIAAAFAMLGPLLFVACGGAGTGPITAASQAVAAADSALALGTAAQVASPFAKRAPTRDTMNGVRDAYHRKMSCADVALAAGMVEVNFAQGCEVNAHTVSGGFTVTHTRTSSASTFGVLLDGLSSYGKTLDGTIQVSGRGSVVTADATLMVSEMSVMAEHLFSGTFTPDATGVIIDGSASRDDGGSARNLAYDTVYLAYGDCYPSAGQITLDGSGQPLTTVAFDAATPSTGEVTVQVGGLPAAAVVLPACPL